MKADISEACERTGERAVLVGHSLGGHVALRFGLQHPDLVGAVVSLAGAHKGVRRETLSTFGVSKLLGNPEGRRDMQHDSDYMTSHLEEVAAGWSPDVGLHVIAATVDDMLPGGHGLDIELPPGQTVHRRIVGWPGTTLFTRLLFSGVPEDTQTLPSLVPAGHYDIPRNPAVINYVRGVQAAVAAFEPGMGTVVDLPEHPLAPAMAAAIA